MAAQGLGREHRPMSEINVTPLVDVMLVLLIIFMVAAPLMNVGVPVDLRYQFDGAVEQGRPVTLHLAAVPELPRLRLSSLDPVEIDDDLYRLLAEEARLMPHLHLSAQAGDDMILKRMKRRHLRAGIFQR